MSAVPNSEPYLPDSVTAASCATQTQETTSEGQGILYLSAYGLSYADPSGAAV
jgi:hypothetical protein